MTGIHSIQRQGQRYVAALLRRADKAGRKDQLHHVFRSLAEAFLLRPGANIARFRLSSMIFSAVLFVCAANGPALAQSDILFSKPHLARAQAGDELSYSYRKETVFGQPDRQRIEQRIRLEIGSAQGDGSHAISITLDADGRPRVLDTFKGVPGNPMLLVFLEGVVSSLHKFTGGSPFYIRNRLKEALHGDRPPTAVGADGTAVVLLHPFAKDRNRARMGPFGNLEIAITVDENAPGMLSHFVARAPAPDGDIYLEEITLEP